MSKTCASLIHLHKTLNRIIDFFFLSKLLVLLQDQKHIVAKC